MKQIAITFTFVLGLISSAAILGGCSKAGSAQSESAHPNGDGSGRQPANPPGQQKPGSVPEGSMGAVGTYHGFIQHMGYINGVNQSVGVTPITIDLRLTQISPVESHWTETINVGFFGGVSISTDAVTYDISSQSLIGTYGTGANPLKVIVNYDGRTVTGAGLNGSNSGFEDIQILDHVREGTAQNASKIYDLSFRGAGVKDSANGVKARLSLTPEIGSAVPSNGASDLPLLPPLNATVAMDGMGSLLSPVSGIAYDPLRGTVEMMFSNRNLIRLEHVYLDPKTAHWGDEPDQLSGRVLQGSSVYADISGKVSKRTSLQFGSIGNGVSYSGTLSRPNGASFKVSAVLLDQNQVIANTPDYVLPQIPVLELRVYVCNDDGGAFGQMSYLLAGLEPIFSTAKFQQEIVGRNVQASGTFGSGWSSIQLTIHSPPSGSSESSGDMKLKLHSTGKSDKPACQ